jgi:hypothetical protein
VAPIAAKARREDSDGYPGVVAVLNSRLRVIRGARVWIAQMKEGSRWTSFAFCTTKQDLLSRLPRVFRRRERDRAAWAIIEALPDHFPKPD